MSIGAALLRLRFEELVFDLVFNLIEASFLHCSSLCPRQARRRRIWSDFTTTEPCTTRQARLAFSSGVPCIQVDYWINKHVFTELI